MDTQESNSKALANARVARYRSKHRRIDYAPSTDVLAIIDATLERFPDWNVQEVIDRLIRTANKSITGNGQSQAKG